MSRVARPRRTSAIAAFRACSFSVSRLDTASPMIRMRRFQQGAGDRDSQLYLAGYRLPHTGLLARPEWLVPEPVELASLTLLLDEGTQAVGINGSEPESEAVRPLRTVGARFERYTSAMKHLSPPALF
ncbi:MAG: hypothetical protein ACRDTT_06320, partial [Pseudonocardiaceae bacterium]